MFSNTDRVKYNAEYLKLFPGSHKKVGVVYKIFYPMDNNSPTMVWVKFQDGTKNIVNSIYLEKA